MTTNGWIYAMALATITLVSCDDDNSEVNRVLGESDKLFVERAALSNLTEIEFGILATSRATDIRIRTYGDQMTYEHTLSQNELRNLIKPYNNVQWPQSIDSTHQQLWKELSALTGSSFDSMYIASQIIDHQQAVNLFDLQINKGEIPEIQNYAAVYQSEVQEHLQRADSLYRMFSVPRDPELNN
jgi:putative membrane protein